jgi:DNA-binding HxlR family transcriptional regulator
LIRDDTAVRSSILAPPPRLPRRRSVMMGGPRCFNELLAAVQGLSDRLLTERLRELETEGLVRRTAIPGPPVRVSYELTEAGESLKPVG